MHRPLRCGSFDLQHYRQQLVLRLYLRLFNLLHIEHRLKQYLHHRQVLERRWALNLRDDLTLSTSHPLEDGEGLLRLFIRATELEGDAAANVRRAEHLTLVLHEFELISISGAEAGDEKAYVTV